MNTPKDDVEFERLAQRWLDAAATPDEARMLWEMVAADPVRARSLASLARFDALLTSTLHTRHRVGEAVCHVTPAPLGSVVPGRVKNPTSVFRSPLLLGLAAALVLLAALGWMLGSSSVRDAGWVVQDVEPEHLPEAWPVTSAPAPRPMGKQDGELAASGVGADGLLAEHLDAFFLPSVELDAVPLGRALGMLQGRMRELDREFLTSGLRVSVPVDAAGRKVSLRCGPISFLKAVRVLAALAGCVVEVDAEKVALILQKDLYPQPSAQRDLLAVLAGRWTSQGRPAVEDESSIAGLLADAASLGIQINTQQSGWQRVRMTRGQFTALEQLTEARAALGLLPAPAFQLYVAESAAGHEPEMPGRTLSQGEAEALLAGGGFSGPISTLTLPLMNTGVVDASAPLVGFRPSGLGREVVLASNAQLGSATEAVATGMNSTQPVLIRSNSTVTLSEDGALYSGAASSVPQTLLLIPVNNPAQPPQP